MSARAGKSIAFIGKSMLWSLSLYVVMMLVFNWDDVSNTIKGKNAVTIVSHSQQPPANNEPYALPASITMSKSRLVMIVSMLKDISGLAKAAVRIAAY